jgi:hypothetical protein
MIRRFFFLGAILAFLSSQPAGAQQDNLKFLDGIWFPVNPPGDQIIFNKINGGMRQVSLPVLGAATVSTSDGRDGSNLKVSGLGFDCYYFYGMIGHERREMQWALKSGPNSCMPTAYFKMDP